MIVTAFDFDKTLTHSDSFFRFLRYTHGNLGVFLRFLRVAPQGIAFKLGRCSRTHVKESAVERFYGGWELQRFLEIAEQFSLEELPKILDPQAIERYRWHKDQGHRCILVSASFEFYLRPWAQSVGFDDVLATRLEVQDGKLTGRFIGENCWGPEKVCRLKGLLGEEKGYELYAYGDSRGDQELLAYADYPYFREMPQIEA